MGFNKCVNKSPFKGIVKSVALIASCLIFSCFVLAGCTTNQDYKPELKQATLAPPAIEKSGVLRVGVNTNNSPLAGKSGERIIGIDVDIAAALGDELGLKIEIVDVGSDAAEAIEGGKVDIALGIESTSAQTDFWVSNQYLPTGVALFELASSNQSTPTAESKPTVAAQISSKSAWAVSNVFGEESLKSSTDLASAFSSLKLDKVDYVASDAIIGLYAASRADVQVKIVALLDTAAGYCAMANADNVDLQKAVADALSTIVENGIVDIIEYKWLGQTVDLAGLPKIEPAPGSNTNVDASGENNNEASDNSNANTSAGVNTNSSTSNAANQNTNKNTNSSTSSTTRT